ncbi:hypothetical protein BIY23_03025 [Wolbachia pipientis]|uniref:SURF1-like protein n=1 Tax=Wolbachia pipientis TaxID=955 RepID=A0A1E7QJW4_WOLPI|nr:SURF1 family protein [Wolbachia pipientis]OEY86646.1 hypothetical protein BIY23_03025 [Wolbachia pipientis]
MLKNIVFVTVLLLLFLLGLWQLFRFNYKNSIIKNIGLPPTHLSQTDNLEKFNYKRVEIDGILSNIELYVFAGKRGYYALSPMLLANGKYMLVNKYITKKKEVKQKEIIKTTLDGILDCNNNKNWFIKNNPSENTWFTLNTREISNELGIKLEKCILWKEFNKLSIQPMKHLEYAITWFVLALIWLVIGIKTRRYAACNEF